MRPHDFRRRHSARNWKFAIVANCVMANVFRCPVAAIQDAIHRLIVGIEAVLDGAVTPVKEFAECDPATA